MMKARIKMSELAIRLGYEVKRIRPYLGSNPGWTNSQMIYGWDVFMNGRRIINDTFPTKDGAITAANNHANLQAEKVEPADPDTIALFEVPNLNCLSVDFGDLLHAAHVLRLLADYAENKGRAMELRAKGDIPMALNIESYLESVYKKLPKWAKW